jgi:hypothetical protein
MIDEIGEEEFLRRKLSYFLSVLFIVRLSALSARKPAHEAGDKKSCHGRQPNSPHPMAPRRSKLTQPSTRNSHHGLTFVFFLAPDRALHHVTGRAQQTFQPIYSMPTSRSL